MQELRIDPHEAPRAGLGEITMDSLRFLPQEETQETPSHRVRGVSFSANPEKIRKVFCVDWEEIQRVYINCVTEGLSVLEWSVFTGAVSDMMSAFFDYREAREKAREVCLGGQSGHSGDLFDVDCDLFCSGGPLFVNESDLRFRMAEGGRLMNPLVHMKKKAALFRRHAKKLEKEVMKARLRTRKPDQQEIP